MSSAESPVADDLASPAPPSRFAAARRTGGRVGVGLAVLGLIVTAVAWLLPFRTTMQAGVYDVFAAVAFFSRVFLLPMAVGWAVLGIGLLVCRQRGWAVLCGLLAIGWAAPEVWMAWPRAVAKGGPSFAVASFNLNKDLRDATWAATVMRQFDADVVVLQELSPHAAAQIKTQLADVYPHTALYPDDYFNGMGVLSKTPLILLQAPESYERRDLAVEATIGGKPVVLVDVHFAPPQKSEKRRRNRWQVADFVKRHANERRPMILAGDFNFTAMTPNAFALRAAGFRDAQLEVGGGRHASWPAKSATSPVPTVRIDTVYGRGDFGAVESIVGPDIGSDHLPVKTVWQWAK